MVDVDFVFDCSILIFVDVLVEMILELVWMKCCVWLCLVLMISVLLLIVVIGGYFWLIFGCYFMMDNVYVKQDVILISFDVLGCIVFVNVCENQVVKVGDVLFVIDLEFYCIVLVQVDVVIVVVCVQVSMMLIDVGGVNVDIESVCVDIVFV